MSRLNLGRVLLFAVLLATPAAIAQRIEKPQRVQRYEAAAAKAAEARRAVREAHPDRALALREEAAVLLQDALRYAPTYANAAALYGQVLLELSKHEAAVAMLRRALKTHGPRPRLERLLGIHLYRLGRYNEGARALERAARHKEVPFDVYYLLLSHYYRTHRYPKALRAAKAYLAERPRDAAVHGVVGNIYLRTGQIELAMASFRQVLTLDPNNVPVRVNLGNVFFKLGDLKSAVGMYEEVIARRPELGLVYDNLGASYYGLRRWREAAQAFQRFLELEPDSERGHYFCGAALAELSQYEAAVRHLSRATALAPKRARAPVRLARLALDQGDLVTADSYAETAVKRAPDTPKILLLAGIVARKRMDLSRAVERLSEVIRLAPRTAVAHAELGYATLLRGDLDAGIRSLRTAQNLSGAARRVEAWLPVALTRRGVVKAMAGRLDGAAGDFEAALALMPALSDASWNLALVWDLQGKPKAGLGVLKAALLARPRDPNLQLAAAWLLARVGRLDRAQKALRAARGATDVAMRHLIQGAIHGALGEFDAAARAFLRARQAGIEPGRILVRARLDRAAGLLQEGRFKDGLRALAALPAELPTEEAGIRAGLEVAGRLSSGQRLSQIPSLLDHLPAQTIAGYGIRRLVRDADLIRGYVRYRMGSAQAAREALERHLRRHPEDSRATTLLVAVLADLGETAHANRRYREAEALLKQAQRWAPKDGRIQHNLAVVRYSGGAHAQAAKTFLRLANQGRIAEAELNLGLYLDDVVHDGAGALARYRHYVGRAGIAAEVARSRIERKERIFGP